MQSDFANSTSSRSNDPESVPVNKVTQQVLASLAGKLKQKKINVDTDIEPVSAKIDKRSIHLAVTRLIENAVDSMPDGGCINVTLIDGPYQWELEVADSTGEIYGDQWKQKMEANDYVHNNNLARISPENPRLEAVRAVVSKHGGQIQSWVCPQGGAAHVLVIPRRQKKVA